VGSLALFIVLSGFSGLRDYSLQFTNIFDSDLKVYPSNGKTFSFSKSSEDELKIIEGVQAFSKVIEERVFLEYNEKTEIAFIKGVEENYPKISKIDAALSVGTWLQKDFENTAVIGRGISNKLSLGILNYGAPLKIMIPKPGKGFINPRKPFYDIETQIVGVYLGTEEFESKYVFTAIAKARELLRYTENQVTAIELRLKDGKTADGFADQLGEKLGENFKVQTKEQLNEVFYKVINTENFVSYLIFTLIVIIALFIFILSIT
jgi:lipoprotein-releasing system permease protein